MNENDGSQRPSFDRVLFEIEEQVAMDFARELDARASWQLADILFRFMNENPGKTFPNEHWRTWQEFARGTVEAAVLYWH
jgi:hypothetical protein